MPISVSRARNIRNNARNREIKTNPAIKLDIDVTAFIDPGPIGQKRPLFDSATIISVARN